MRLEQDANVLEIELRRRVDCGFDFRGMMRVVVNNGDTAGFAYQIEAPANTRKRR